MPAYGTFTAAFYPSGVLGEVLEVEEAEIAPLMVADERIGFYMMGYEFSDAVSRYAPGVVTVGDVLVPEVCIDEVRGVAAIQGWFEERLLTGNQSLYRCSGCGVV